MSWKTPWIARGVLAALLALAAPACGDDDNRRGADETTEDTDFRDFLGRDADEPDTDSPEDTSSPDDAAANDAAPDDAAEPDVAEPDAAEPDAAEPDAAEPDAAEPEDTGPADPWASADGLADEELKEQLHSLIDDHRSYAYTEARDFMYGRSGNIDVRSGMIECVYTGRLVAPDGTRTPGGFNTEHSWPKNEGAQTPPPESDIHHLFPSDEQANNARASYEFGDVSCGARCDWSGGGSRLGSSMDGRDRVFEVRPERQGDIARAHFYFSVRYELAIGALEEAVLRRWHDADPPSDLEISRNDRIEFYQQNRNPFIDRPDFVEQISDF